MALRVALFGLQACELRSDTVVDLGDADEDSIAPASWPDYPFSEQLDASLSLFLAERRVVTPDEQDGGLAVALLVGGAAVAVVAGAIGIVVIRRRRPTPG